MKNFWNTAAMCALLAGSVLVTACNKNDTGSLEGAVPTTSFTFQANTAELPTVVNFTSTSQDGFVYQWRFGDGTIGSGATVMHTYTHGGTYTVSLIAAGKGGTSTPSTQEVVIPDACDNATFSKLVDCAGSGIRVWTLSSEPGAIVRQDASGQPISTSAGLEDCQANDQFAFSNSFTLNYESGGATYNTKTGKCDKSLSGGGSFVFRTNPSGNPQIVLKAKGAFIGLADSVANKTYDILEVTDTKLRLRGTNPDGTFTVTTYAPYDATAPTKRLLTGGSSKTWMLDDNADLGITVGIESDPKKYYGGAGPNTLPGCQTDDDYTFSSDNTLKYDAKGETFVAGVYACQAPRDYTTPFVFGPASGTGLAQFRLTKAGSFIGATDASPTEQVYRILSIDDKHMVLRAGSGLNGGTVFDIKLVAK